MLLQWKLLRSFCSWCYNSLNILSVLLLNVVALILHHNVCLSFQKGLSEEKKSLYDWTNKEKSKSLDKPSYDRYSKKEDKEKDKKDNKLSGSCEIESELRDRRGSSRGKLGANEMLDSDNPPPEYNKQDCMVSGLEDFEVCIPIKFQQLQI